MVKLLFLLFAGMFATLLIGGRDNGQVRHGLIAVEEPAGRPVVREAAVAKPAVAKPAPATQAALAAYVPVSAPVAQPVAAVQPVAPQPAAVQQPAVQPQTVQPVVASTALPLLYVKNTAINVREGPSTNHPVVGRLARAEAVLVVEPEADGWVRIRIEGDGIEGFVAARLMTDVAP